MKIKILALIVFICYLSSCSSTQQQPSYIISFDYKPIKLSSKNVEKHEGCLVNFQIEDTNYPIVENNFIGIRGTYAEENKRIISNLNISVYYGKLATIRIGDIQTLKVLIPNPNSSRLPSYIFTQKNIEPKCISLNPSVIEEMEKKTTEQNHGPN